ncbi:MAG: CoA transferase [Deltaproteobacteria bacterium]|nr:CoA transferase [Deltaproteobacteria bacterium]
MSRPLVGTKVIEIGQEIQGPFAGLCLADLGADVIKIENKEGGDLSRAILAGLIGGPKVRNAGMSHYYNAMNRGKRSVTVDLKHPEGAELVRRLARVCDVVLTNYRIGVLDRLGLGFEDLKKANPRIVFAQGSSWGPRGPWVTRPSRDILAQAASGIVAKGGRPADPPMPAPFAVADQSGGLSLAAGILAALFARERTGQAQRVDVSIYGTMIALQTFEMGYAGFTGEEPARAGCGHQFLHGAWGTYRTRDGYICLGSVDDNHWPAFCRVLGIQDLQNDPELAGLTRIIPGDKMEKVLLEIFPRRTTAEWLPELHAADVLVTEVVDYRGVMASEQARLNGYVVEVEHGAAGSLAMPGTPISLNGELRTAAPPAPELGQHTEEVMLEAGYSWEDISRVRDSGAV